MVSKRELKRLAYVLFLMTRRDVWLGGRTDTSEGSKDWPRASLPLGAPGRFWTLSPEVALGGHRLRVCVFTTERYAYLINGPIGDDHHVGIYVDDEVKHPGGHYAEWDAPWWQSWSGQIARQEIEEGGKTGPVDRRDLLIAEAERALGFRGAAVVKAPPDPDAERAVREVEALVRGKRPQREG